MRVATPADGRGTTPAEGKKLIEAINIELRKIDPGATVMFLGQEEITLECAEEHKGAVAKRLGELLYVTHLHTTDFIDTEGEVLG